MTVQDRARSVATEPPWRTAGAGVLLVGLAAMSVLYAPQALLAPIAAEFSRSAFEANLAVSATTAGIAVGVFPMAWIAMRVGRRRSMTAALVAGVLLTATTALADSWWMLVAARVGAGLAIATVLVSAQAWVGAAVAHPVSRRAAGLYVAGTTAGGMAGRIVSGVVAEQWGWRAGVLVVDVVVVVATIAGVALLLRHDRRPDRGVLRRAPSTRAGSAPRIARVALVAIGGLGTTMFVGVFNAVTFRMLEPPFELGVAATSTLFLCYAAGTWSSARTGRIVERLGARGAVLAGTAVAAIGIAVTVVDHLAAVVAGLLLLAAGFFVVHTTASSTIAVVSPRPTIGSAWYTLGYYAGASVGALALGAAWDAGRWLAVATAALALLSASAIVALALPARTADGDDAPTSPDPGTVPDDADETDPHREDTP
ncbi:MFS transporter [Agrococcus jejuensis]|uniref:MFS transporter n=1 Tax=Agrococcus jejuensis TaxID=399736 RepID=UPI0011A33FC4|nr:MFS transporter [Agrococcus jejuensis]